LAVSGQAGRHDKQRERSKGYAGGEAVSLHGRLFIVDLKETPMIKRKLQSRGCIQNSPFSA
jgi:hypothetical protein